MTTRYSIKWLVRAFDGFDKGRITNWGAEPAHWRWLAKDSDPWAPASSVPVGKEDYPPDNAITFETRESAEAFMQCYTGWPYYVARQTDDPFELVEVRENPPPPPSTWTKWSVVR